MDELDSQAQNQTDRELVTSRLHQLALAKILVLTHGRHLFRLVLAHHQLGKAYFLQDFLRQAIENYSVAIRVNNKLFGDVKATKQYQVLLLTALGRTYMRL
jgi:hypothetical protein